MDISRLDVQALVLTTPAARQVDCERSDETRAKPLCVDLDGTLVLTDLLMEGVFSILSRRQTSVRLLRALTSGRAAVKQEVSQLAECVPELLPYNETLIAYLKTVRATGRPLILVTAADAGVARAIAAHLDLFDDVIASDGATNLKGKAKAIELVRRYGRGGFDYAGNSRADLSVWREADRVVIVNASRSVAREARLLGKVLVEIDSGHSRLRGAFRAMRPHQWVKNRLVFIPLLTSQSFDDWSGIGRSLMMFMSFCVTASAIYMTNDLMDLTSDRRHPRKRRRPFASGALALTWGLGIAAILLSCGLGLAALVGTVHIIALYASISFLYSLILKTLPLVDVFMLSALYTSRIVAGGVASSHPVSLWLLAFAGFTFLSLALVKRVAELRPTEHTVPRAHLTRRGYVPEDRSILMLFGIAAAFSSSVVLALFVGSTAAFERYRSPELLWALVPMMLFWQCRVWLSTERGYMHDDPIVYASSDWVSWLVGASIVGVVVASSVLHW